MTTIRGNNPSLPRVPSKNTGPLVPLGTTKTAATVAATAVAAVARLEASAQSAGRYLRAEAATNLGRELGAEAQGSGADPKVAARYVALADTHLNVALVGKAADRLSLSDARSPLLSETTFARLEALPKTLQKEVKQEITQAVARQWLGLADRVLADAQARAVLADPRTKPNLATVASFVSSMRAQAKAEGALPKDAQAAVQAIFERFASDDIESLVAIVMMECSKDARLDVKAMLDEMSKVNAQKKAMRAKIAERKAQGPSLDASAKAKDASAASAAEQASKVEAALAAAEKALAALEAAKRTSTQAADGRASEAEALAAEAALAALAVAAAVPKAKLTAAALNGQAAVLGELVGDGIAASASKWSDGLTAGLPQGVDFGTMIYLAYNKGKPAAQQTSDPLTMLAQLFPNEWKLPTNADNALSNLVLYKQAAAAALANATSEQQKKKIQEIIKELDIHGLVLQDAKTGVPASIARTYYSLQSLVTDAAKKTELEGIYAALRASPRSAKAYGAAMHAFYGVTAAVDPYGSTFTAVRNDIDRYLRALPAPPYVAEFGELTPHFGLSAEQWSALRTAYETLPGSTAGDDGAFATWVYSLADATPPVLKTLENTWDFDSANENRRALAAFINGAADQLVGEAEAAAALAKDAETERQGALDAARKNVEQTAANMNGRLADAQKNVADARTAAADARAAANRLAAEAVSARAETEANQGEITRLQTEMDTLGDLTSENQLRMQMYMERMQKAQQMLSNLMASLAKTKETIVGNLK